MSEERKAGDVTSMASRSSSLRENDCGFHYSEWAGAQPSLPLPPPPFPLPLPYPSPFSRPRANPASTFSCSALSYSIPSSLSVRYKRQREKCCVQLQPTEESAPCVRMKRKCKEHLVRSTDEKYQYKRTSIGRENSNKLRKSKISRQVQLAFPKPAGLAATTPKLLTSRCCDIAALALLGSPSLPFLITFLQFPSQHFPIPLFSCLFSLCLISAS